MTREEAKNSATAWVIESVSVPYVKEQVKVAIDEIYDDFESRTCENCKYREGMCKYGIVAPLFSSIKVKEFGCNKFERKKDEEI